MTINWTKETWTIDFTKYSYEDNSNPDKIIHASVTYEDDPHEGCRWEWDVSIYTPYIEGSFKTILRVDGKERFYTVTGKYGYTRWDEEEQALSLAQKYIEEH